MTFSRFYLCDLQVHTPADHHQGYGNVGGREPNSAFARRLIEAHVAAGVQVIAVTDHNRVDWYPVLREAGDELGVTVFPGVEISVNGCHLLLIWERSDYDLAQQFLASLWDPGTPRFLDNGETRPVARGQVLDIADRAREHRALVLAPHATTKKMGLFASGVCSNSDEIAQSGKIIGFDIYGNKHADVLKAPRGKFGDILPPWFITSDTRSFGDVGKRAAYLKLGGTATLEGLRQAFTASATRVRLPMALQGEWGHVQHLQFLQDPEPAWPRIASIAIEGGFHDGLAVDLGPGLNAIIGGKGTGKSTLIEIMRYVLDAPAPAEPELTKNREANFPANAQARITFRTGDGNTYVALRSGDNTPARLTINGQELGIPVARRAPVRIFGQRELRTLVERQDLRREFVASQIGDEWLTASGQERELLGRIQELGGQLDTIDQNLNQLGELETERTDLREKLERVKERGIAELILRAEASKRVDAEIRDALTWPTKVRGAVDQLSRQLPAPTIARPDGVPNPFNAILTDLANATAGAIAQLHTAIAAVQRDLEAPRQSWEALYAAERKEINAALAVEKIYDMAEIDQDQHRIVAIEGLLGKLQTARAEAARIAAQRAALLHELADVRRLQSRLVERAATKLTSAVGARVRVLIEPLANRQTLHALLVEAVRGQGVQREQLNKLAKLPPATIAEAIAHGPTGLQKLGLSLGTASRFADLPAQTLRRIEECATPDSIVIEIDLGSATAPRWTPIEQASPGQRSTAMLALALSSGDEPLIIDQPEDDLDNRFIYDEVVKILSLVCRSRQVIVATHNANIPILGDAELIIALDAAAAKASILACGGLEDARVADCARHILEGGDEAFRARHNRYQAAGK